MRRTLLVILRTLKWALILCAFVYVALVLVNLRDEELSAEERSLAQYHNPAVVDGQNAYLALLGFGAPSGTNPIEEGARRIADHNAAAAGDPWGRERLAKIAEGKLQTAEGRKLNWAGGPLQLPDAFDPSYLDQARAHAGDVQQLLNANAELVSRYRALLKLPEFSDTAAPDILAPITTGGSHSQIRRLLLAQSAIDAQSGNADRALDFLSADSGLWRRVLAGSGTLVDEMLAVRFLASDLHVVSALLTTGKFDALRHRAILLELTRPLGKLERNLTPMFAKEFAINAVLFEGMLAEERRVNSENWLHYATNVILYEPFFKINATLNRSARLFSAYSRLSELSPREFLATQAQVKQATDAIGNVTIGWLYNPMGHILVGIAAPQYQVYAGRVMDLAAYVDLVRAQMEWHRAANREDRSPASVDGENIAPHNPYTEQPFHWDASDQSLSFSAVSDIWKQWGTKVFVQAAIGSPKAK
jgi:hypothetical protein